VKHGMRIKSWIYLKIDGCEPQGRYICMRVFPPETMFRLSPILVNEFPKKSDFQVEMGGGYSHSKLLLLLLCRDDD
jgi:hypothetical protein